MFRYVFGVVDALKRKETGLGRRGSESKSRKEVNGNLLPLRCPSHKADQFTTESKAPKSSIKAVIKKSVGPALVAQQLRLCLSVQGVQAPPLVREYGVSIPINIPYVK